MFHFRASALQHGPPQLLRRGGTDLLEIRRASALGQAAWPQRAPVAGALSALEGVRRGAPGAGSPRAVPQCAPLFHPGRDLKGATP